MNRTQIPNCITMFRLILIIPFLIALFFEKNDIALYIFILAGISDGLDGLLARRYQWTSQFGAFMDPLADKLLMVLSYLALGYLGHLPFWIVAIVIGRDILIMICTQIYRVLIEEPVYSSTFISKLNTVLQLLLVVLVLFNQVYFLIPERFIIILMYVVASTTISSFLDYVWIWGRRAYWVKRGKA